MKMLSKIFPYNLIIDEYMYIVYNIHVKLKLQFERFKLSSMKDYVCNVILLFSS